MFNNTFHLLDRFHVVDHLEKAVDNLRRAEVKKLKEAGELTYLKNVAGFSEKNDYGPNLVHIYVNCRI